MGKTAKQAKAGGCSKVARSRAKSCTGFVLKVLTYLVLASSCLFTSTWNWTYEPNGLQCSHGPRGAKYNRTRLKVLAYSASKTGTTSLAHLLGELFENSYHSEDFAMHIWSPLADRHWQQPENGGSIWPWNRLTTAGPPAYAGHSMFPRGGSLGSDRRLHDALQPHELAEAVEKCSVDAFVPDGMERLFWDIYEVSPEAKVLMLNWRSLDDMLRSNDKFLLQKTLLHLFLLSLNVGVHFLPWGALLFPLLDALSGTLTKFLTQGECLFKSHSPPVVLWKHALTERRIAQHWVSGFGEGLPPWEERFRPANQTELDEYWAIAKRRIPKDRLFEVDPRKHSPADICKMLGITDKPICKDTGRMKAVQPHLVGITSEKASMFVVLLLWLFLHWVNYNLFWGVIIWLLGNAVSLLGGRCAAQKAQKIKRP